ncbi:MAG TPA: S8 family serine peptidase [Mycobacteriales bacterium]|jgi:serine protease|nr:S8 family serine peptidase [Mycobacteriales bacterium]
MLRRLLTAAALVAAGTAVPQAHAAGGDPLYQEQYALTQLHAPQAWTRAQGRGVVVAVVDSGVDLGHPDLRGRLVKGATFLRCGETSCGNGDWRSGPADRRKDAYGHGTHVAGAIVAGRNNGVGIVGIAPLAKVMPIKITDRQGNSSEHDVALAFRWAVRHGATVINASLGYPSSYTEVVAAAQYAVDHGVVVVASAGNRSEPTCLEPAAVPGVICVTATDRNEAPAAYSSGAVKDGMRSVAAPGGAGQPGSVYTVALPQLPVPACEERILSTWPRGDAGLGRCPGEGGYRFLSGTSLSSPYVAGVAALLLSQGRSAQNTVDVILKTARTPGVGPGVWTPQYGYGIADAGAAVRAPR